jgi:hypothetical protein
MDIESRNKWVEYSKAKDEMLAYTDTKISPWYVVRADNKKRARLNCIAHLLDKIPYKDVKRKITELPQRKKGKGYIRPPMGEQNFVPEVY